MTGAIPSARAVSALRRSYTRDRTGGTSVSELATVWGGGVLSMTGLGAWVLSGRDVGWSHEQVLPDMWAVAAGIGAAVVVLHLLRVIGPVGTDSATTHWAVGTPVDRRSLLFVRASMISAAAVIIGILTARVLALAATASIWWPLAVIGGSTGLLVAALSMLGQQDRRVGRALPVLEGLGVVAAFGSLVVPPFPAAWMVPAAVASAVPAAGLWSIAMVRLGRVRRSALTAGAEIATAVQVSGSFADGAFLASAIEHRVYRRIGAVRSRRFPTGVVRALVWSDVLRHSRNRSLAAVFGASSVVVVAAAATAPSPVSAVIALVAAYGVVSTAGVGLRDVAASGSGKLALPTPDAAVARAFMVVPVCAATAFSVVVALACGPVVGLVVGVFACIAVYRSRTSPPIVYDGLAVITPFGSVPIDLIRQQLRGPGTLVPGAIVLLLL